MIATGATQQRDPSHIRLDDSIDRLESVVESLDSLIRKISGDANKEPKSENVTKAMPSLMDVLQHGDERISEIHEKLNDRINRLSDLLF